MTVATRRIKVVTFNAYHGYPLCPHIESRLSMLERALLAEAPDVVLLQEMSVSLLYGNLNEKLAEALRAKGLSYSIAYEPANGSVRDGGVFEEGSAIFSRWPIEDAEARRLAAAHVVRREYHGYEYEECRIALRATLQVAPDVRLDVFGAHVTDAPSGGERSARRLQIEDLAAFVAGRPSRGMPAIIGGDFNAVPESAEIEWLRAQGFLDLCAHAEPGPTNDRDDRDLESAVDTANQRIDHLFVAGDGVRVHEVRRFLDSAFELEPGRFLWASDHSGVLAVIELPVAPATRR